jgi:hypothetical protein
MESLFDKGSPEGRRAPTPHELIEPEIVHLKKGYSIRHGEKKRSHTPSWLVVLGFCGLAWLYLMDPFIFAWYKGEAVRTYLYLHNYGTGPLAESLAVSGIFTPDEVITLNHRQGSYQDYYASPQEASSQAESIIAYLNNVHLLHTGKYQKLDPVGRMRYLLFIRTGIVVPTMWTFLNPSIE